MNDNSSQDKSMIINICNTLDNYTQQTHAFDHQLEMLAQKAQNERQQRLSKYHQAKKWWLVGGSLAFAACVMLVVLNPIQLQHATQTQATTTVVFSASVDPQLLEDMDMLIVLGEEQ
jgi:hypothetical protein